LKPASFLTCILLIVPLLPTGRAGAMGLYESFPSFFAPTDTVRAISLRQTECDLGGTRASLLAAEVTLRPTRRFVTRFELAFPALRRGDEFEYGAGDLLLRGALRLTGDSLEASGIYLRADLRMPSGSKHFRPFSNGTFEADAGLEARVGVGGFALRGAVLHTIAGEKTHETGFSDDTHLTLAAAAAVPLPRIATAGASVFVVRFDDGGSREIGLLTLDRVLSRQLVLEVAGVFETGAERSRVFDACAAVSLRYLFPPRLLTPRPDSIQP
jgi:hypothetical protein